MSDRSCSEPSCEAPYWGRGFCSEHYSTDRASRIRAEKRAGLKRVNGVRVCEYCSAAIAESAHARKRVCNNTCWQRMRKGLPLPGTSKCRHCGTPLSDLRRKQCGAPECVRVAAALQVKLHRRARTGEALLTYRLADRNSQHVRRLAKQGFVVTARDLRRLLERQRHRCAYCDQGGELTIEHVVPLRRGGRHTIGNIVFACRRCNSSKWRFLLTEWRAGYRRPGRAVEAGVSRGISNSRVVCA